jgi:hypothetical protein
VTTLRRFANGNALVAGGTSWYLADLGELRGKQTLYTRQSPQRLKALREHALIESTVSSNRIEGVTVETGRVRALVLGTPLLKDRDEEEVRGYRDALTLIHDEVPRREPGYDPACAEGPAGHLGGVHRPRARGEVTEGRRRCGWGKG